MRAFLRLLSREMAHAWASGGGAASPAAFFLAACALSAFAIGADLGVLGAAAPGALTLAFVFVALLGLEHLYQADLETGAMDLIALGEAPLTLAAAAKILARSIATLVPAAALAPIGGVLLGLTPVAALWAGLTLALAAPGLVAAGSAPAALAAGRARGGLLIAVITPPLCAPMVIFAAGAIRAASFGEPLGQAMALLAASSLGALVVGSVGAAAALRMHME